MSRSYYEWREAQTKWLLDQGLRTDSIPYPGRESVLYDRESTNPFWQRRYDDALSKINLTSLNYHEDTAVALFEKIADAEYQKEQKILEKFLPAEEISNTDSFIDKINLLMQNRDRYIKLLERIQMALAQEKSGGAPDMSSLFATYFEPILIEKMEQFQAEFMGLDDPKARYYELINEGLKEASTKMAMASKYRYDPGKKKYTKERSIHGGAEDWREINRALKDLPGMWDLFTRNVMKSIGNWDTLYSRLVQEDFTPAGSSVKDILQLSGRTFSIGGNVAENAAAAVAVRLNKLRGSNGQVSWDISGGALTQEGKVTADSFVVFSASSTISARDVFENLNAADQKNYMDKLNDTVEQFKNNLNDLFGIFINAKNYSIGTGQDATYEKTIQGTFEDLPNTFEELQVNVSNIEDFIITAYNTGDGAIAADMRGEVEESLIQALRVGVSKIMFDDYATIGNMNNGNIIHLYQIDQKFVPSSVIFKSLAEATQEAVQVRARVYLPHGVNDEGPDWPGSNDAEIKEYIYNHWQEEIAQAKAASHWYATFVLNVKKALQLS